MLYLIDTDLDFVSFGERREAVLAAEDAQLREDHAAGRLLRIWTKGNARGTLSLWDLPEHKAVDRLLAARPLYWHWSRIDIVPLVPHLLFPQYSVRHDPPRTVPARGQLYRLQLEIDRAKAGPAVFEKRLESAEHGAGANVRSGLTVGIWRRLHGSGAVLVWDAPSHKAVHDVCAALPLLPYMREVKLDPLVPHPALPELASWRP